MDKFEAAKQLMYILWDLGVISEELLDEWLWNETVWVALGRSSMQWEHAMDRFIRGH